MNLTQIRKAFDAIYWVFDSKNTNYAQKLLEQCKGEEKGHRGWGPDFAKYHPDAASVTDCAKVFAVKRIAEYLTGAPFPKGKDYLHFQLSCFTAAGMVDEFGDELRTALAAFDLAQLAALDYCDFVKVREMATA